jgi:hypothetical protein
MCLKRCLVDVLFTNTNLPEARRLLSQNGCKGRVLEPIHVWRPYAGVVEHLYG